MTPEELLEILRLPDSTIEWTDGWDQRRVESEQGIPPVTGKSLVMDAVSEGRYFKREGAGADAEAIATAWLMGYLTYCVGGERSV